MKTLESWQTTIVIVSIVAAVCILATRGEVNGDVAVTGLIGLGASILGAKAAVQGQTAVPNSDASSERWRHTS